MYSEEQGIPAPRPFRVCESCGQLTPSNSPQCAYCGAMSLQAVAAARQEQETQQFFHVLFSRASPVSYALIAINIIYYLVVSLYGLESATLIAFGAKTNQLLREGDWFRLVTPIFIHGGLLHLFSNSYALWANGPLVEKLYGSSRFLLIYLLTGIGGVAGSYIWQEVTNHPDVPSVGASGALFGLFGLLAVFGYKYKEVPREFQRALRSSVFPVIAINLIIGFSLPFIDNGAHIGGLLVGALLAFVIPYAAPGSKRFSAAGVAVLSVCVILIGLSFWGALRQSPDHLVWREKNVQLFLDGFNDAQKAMREIAVEGKPNPAALVTAISNLERTQAFNQPSAAIISETLGVLRQQQELIRQSASSQEVEKNLRAYSTVRRKYEAWMKEEGDRLGARHGWTFTNKDSAN